MSLFVAGRHPEFVPSQQGLSYDFSSLTAPSLSFVVAERSSSLSSAKAEILRSFATWEHPVPCIDLKEGRTAHAILADGAQGWPQGLTGIKVKGIAGLRYEDQDRKWHASRLAPQVSYEVVPEILMSLDHALNLRVFENDHKALYSIIDRRAKIEFEAQQRLAVVNLGHPGLMWGRYQTNDGQQMLDLHGQPVGAVFSGYDPRFTILGLLIPYHMIENLAGEPRLLEEDYPQLGLEEKIRGRKLFIALSIAHNTLYVEMAKSKRIAALEVYVGNHDGHVGNFLVDRDRDQCWITDTDSCCFYDQLTANQRGPQLLSDIAEDLWRCAARFSAQHFTSTYLIELANQGRFADTFSPYLKAYFTGLATDSDIDSISKELYRRYAEFIAGKIELLLVARELLIKEALGELEPGVSAIGNWMFIQRGFLPQCIIAVSKLMRCSSLASRGFSLPEIDEQVLAKQLNDGIRRYFQTVIDNQNRFKKAHGRPESILSADILM